MAVFLSKNGAFYPFGDKITKICEKKCEKIWRIKKSPYLCSPFEKERSEKFIEKTDYCTRSKYRENTIYREALISLEIISVRDKLRIIYKIYNEEFDPGSG